MGVKKHRREGNRQREINQAGRRKALKTASAGVSEGVMEVIRV